MNVGKHKISCAQIIVLFLRLSQALRSNRVFLQHILQGTVTGKIKKIVLNDEPTDGRLISVSEPGYISNNSHRRT